MESTIVTSKPPPVPATTPKGIYGEIKCPRCGWLLRAPVFAFILLARAYPFVLWAMTLLLVVVLACFARMSCLRCGRLPSNGLSPRLRRKLLRYRIFFVVIAAIPVWSGFVCLDSMGQVERK